jgi:hypothetical protein
MKADRRTEIERLYEAALEREAFLDRACRGDDAQSQPYWIEGMT